MSRHVDSLSIDTVVTFDRYGVSSHKNHIALYYAMACLAMEVYFIIGFQLTVHIITIVNNDTDSNAQSQIVVPVMSPKGGF